MLGVGDLKKRYDLEGGRNYTVVAALRPSGAPTSDIRQPRAPDRGGDRSAHPWHIADAPAVNVWAESTRLIGGTAFTWGDESRLAVPEGRYRVRVTLSGSRSAVIGPRRLTLCSGHAYQVHAVGSPDRYRLVVVRVGVGTE